MAVRTTATVAEALITPTSQAIRSTFNAAEALVLPTTQRIRSSQIVVEALIREGGGARTQVIMVV